MSVGLIELIFENLDYQNLDRTRVLEHLEYLKEITAQDTTFSRSNKISGYQSLLERRLLQLDKEMIQNYSYPLTRRISVQTIYPIQDAGTQFRLI